MYFQCISAHSTNILDVCSCVRTSRVQVGETEQGDILQMFSGTLRYSSFEWHFSLHVTAN